MLKNSFYQFSPLRAPLAEKPSKISTRKPKNLQKETLGEGAAPRGLREAPRGAQTPPGGRKSLQNGAKLASKSHPKSILTSKSD